MSVLRRLRCERALALPFALLVMAISGASIVTVVQFTSSSGRTATVAKGRVSAESLAEAGLANAFAVLNNPSNNPTTHDHLLGCDADGTSCTPVVSTYTGGTATWSGWLDSTGGSSKWRITSIGQVANPSAAGAPALKVTLLARVPLQTTTGPPNASVWNYAYSTKPPGAGCEVDVNGSTSSSTSPSTSPATSALSGSNAMIDERGEGQTPAVQPIDVRVGGKLVFTGSNAHARPVERLHHERCRPGWVRDLDQRRHPDLRAAAVQLVRDDGRHVRADHGADCRLRELVRAQRHDQLDLDGRGAGRRLRRPQRLAARTSTRHAARRRRRLDQPDPRLRLHLPEDDRRHRRRHGRLGALVERLDDVDRQGRRSSSTARDDRRTTTPPTTARRRSTRTAPSPTTIPTGRCARRVLRLHDVEPEHRDADHGRRSLRHDERHRTTSGRAGSSAPNATAQFYDGSNIVVHGPIICGSVHLRLQHRAEAAAGDHDSSPRRAGRAERHRRSRSTGLRRLS